METVEILRKAKAELERRGLHNGDFAPTDEETECYVEDANCPVCAAGAINVACGGEPDDCRGDGADAAYLAFLRGIEAREMTEHDEPVEVIGRWNDRRGRTKEEVLAAFDRAIALASPPPGSQPPVTWDWLIPCDCRKSPCDCPPEARSSRVREPAPGKQGGGLSVGRVKPFTLLVRRSGVWGVWGVFDSLDACGDAYRKHVSGRGITPWSWWGPSETADRMLADPSYDPDAATPPVPGASEGDGRG